MKRIQFFLIFGLIAGLLACGENTSDETVESPATEYDNPAEELNEELEDVPAVPELYGLESGKAGDFGPGAAIPETTEKYSVEKKSVTKNTEEGSYEEVVYTVTDANGELMSLLEKYDYETDTYLPEIGEINISSDRFQTKEGIGVGSTIAEFTEAYTDYEIWYTYISDMFVIETKQLDIRFLLDEEGFNGKVEGFSDMETLKMSDFNEDTKITSIRMYEAE